MSRRKRATDSKSRKITTTVYLEGPQHHALAALAVEQDRPVARLIREGVNLVLRRYKQAAAQ